VNRIAKVFFSLVVLCFAVTTARAQSHNRALSGKLIIFHAGSLSVPFRQISEEFNRHYPKVKIFREAAGSRMCARKISDLHRRCDIIASADYTVIDTLLIDEHAEWNIKFASNEMVVAYRADARQSSEINPNNWYEILLNKDIAFGRSDPNSDPCGYRAVLTVKLAEKFYGRAGLADKMLKKDRRYIRPKEVDLLALLEVGELDYVFTYRSLARQHGLGFVTLPDEINLKSERFADFYAGASVRLTGKKPGTFITRTGAPIIYGVAIPKNAPNPEAATMFLAFLLDVTKGGAILEKNGQSSVVPSPTETFEKLPEKLKRFALPAKERRKDSRAKKEN